MKDVFPEQGTIHAALEMAVRAPSLHNSQPWRWRIGDRSIHLYADQSRNLEATDPEGRELIISCGAALHHLRVALAALGWTCTIHRLPDRSDLRHLAAIELEATEPSADAVVLAAQINRRRSDRRPYRASPLPPFAVTQISRNTAAYGMTVRFVTDPHSRHELSLAVAEADDIESIDIGYRNEVQAWSGQHFGSDDGVPARSVPPDAGYDGVRLRHFAHPEMPAQNTVGETDSTEGDVGTLIVLGTETDDVYSWLLTGEATGTILLTATGFGLASCPLTQPLEVDRTRRLLRDAVLGGTVHPQMILRVGFPITDREPPATPRRTVREVLDVYDGAPAGTRAIRNGHHPARGR